MRRGLIALAVALSVLAPAPAQALTCSIAEISAGLCSVGGGTNNGGVNLWLDGESTGSGTTDQTTPCADNDAGRCVGGSPGKSTDIPESVHDLETFRPNRPSQFSQPAGWTLIGLPTNFVTRATSHIVSGELAGHAADVRFIPVRFRRSFGDGTGQTTTVRGSRWRTPWADTATSHVYSRSATLTVTLNVDYVADYRFSGLGWVRLDGVVSIGAEAFTITVFDPATVLVALPCNERKAQCR